MKILVINPNISESVTAPFGVAYIETENEAAIGACAAMTLYAEHGTDCDAVVIAAFGDPGLAGVREIAPVPVVGIAEAAFAAAGEFGTRFSIAPSPNASPPGTGDARCSTKWMGTLQASGP